MDLEKTSKKLSFLLRHCTEPLYIDLNGGWALIETILEVLGISRDELDTIVETDSKKRYSYNEDGGNYIRANQGHSIQGVVVEMQQPEPPEYLYHGTATRFLDDILRDGIKPMSRQMVHISSDVATAKTVGMRHGEPVILMIRAKDFVADGYSLYLSDNGVWQAKEVPRKYIEVLHYS